MSFLALVYLFSSPPPLLKCFMACLSGSHQAKARLPGCSSERTDQAAGHRDAAAGEPRRRYRADPHGEPGWVSEGGLRGLGWRWLTWQCSG